MVSPRWSTSMLLASLILLLYWTTSSARSHDSTSTDLSLPHRVPTPDVTYKGVPCRSDHNCGDHGYGYNWCYTTDNDDWDYCGVISPGEFRYSAPRRTKRQPKKPNQNNPPQPNYYREYRDSGTVTRFSAEVNHRDIAESSRRQREEALDLINRWDGQGLGQQARSRLVTSDNLRIDLQGVFNRNNQWYYNVQVQVNRSRGSGESTTLAQILVPDGTPAEYMREALRDNLERRARVSLEVTDQPINNNNNNNNNNRRRRD